MNSTQKMFNKIIRTSREQGLLRTEDFLNFPSCLVLNAFDECFTTTYLFRIDVHYKASLTGVVRDDFL